MEVGETGRGRCHSCG